MSKEFYDHWARQKINDPKRETILKWKGINLLNLIFRNDLNRFLHSAGEIGGAEGTVLHTVSQGLSLQGAVNFEISHTFCSEGKKKYPHLHFENTEFTEKSGPFDLLILSDIVEHVENDHLFLDTVARRCTYVAAKVPVEKCLFSSRLYHAIALRKIPENLKYGPHHINGHLRGYRVRQILSLFSEHFEILDHEITDVSYFYPTPRKVRIKKMLGRRLFILLYGGAVFLVCKSRYTSQS